MAEEDQGIGFEAETCEHGNSVVWVTAFGERVAPMLMVSWGVLCRLREALNKHHAERVAAGIPEAIKKAFEERNDDKDNA